MDFPFTQLRLCRMALDRKGTSGLAARIGMSSTLLGSVERGDLRCHPKWIPVIRASLGVPVDQLFDARGFAVPACSFPAEVKNDG